MNVTIPSALPRAPNRRRYTALNTTATNTMSLTTLCGASSVPAVMASAAGSGNSAIVIFCWRGSGSLTARPETIVISTPSSATVTGWPVARVSRKRITRAQASAAVVRLAIRSRSNPGSEPINQFRARSVDIRP